MDTKALAAEIRKAVIARSGNHEAAIPTAYRINQVLEELEKTGRLVDPAEVKKARDNYDARWQSERIASGKIISRLRRYEHMLNKEIDALQRLLRRFRVNNADIVRDIIAGNLKGETDLACYALNNAKQLYDEMKDEPYED